MLKHSESGRSIIEIIAVIILMLLLILLGMWGFRKASTSARIQTMSKDVSTAVTERRYQITRTGTTKKHTLTTKVGSTQMTVENVTDTGAKNTFTVLLPDQSKETCEEMKKYNVFTPKKIEVNNTENGECQELNTIKFYFDDKNGGGSSGTGGGGSGGGTGGGGETPTPNPDPDPEPDPLGGNCDGKICPTCQRCDAMTGKCVKERDGLIINDCGICKDGHVEQDIKTPDTECRKCKSDWNWNYTAKGTTLSTNDCKQCDGNGEVEDRANGDIDECNKCVAGVKTAKTGEVCATCGQCQADGTCDPEFNMFEYTYRRKDGNDICREITEKICPTETQKTSNCCPNPLPSTVDASCTDDCGCGGGLVCSEGKCLAECKEQEYKYVLQGTGTKCEHCPVAHKATCTTECTAENSPIGCCFSEILDALDDCICDRAFTKTRKHKLGNFSGLKAGNYTISVDNGVWHCGQAYPACTYSRGSGSAGCSCGTQLIVESNGTTTELTSEKTIYLSGETSMYLYDGTFATNIHNGDGCYDNCGQVALKFVKKSGRSCTFNSKTYQDQDLVGTCGICNDGQIVQYKDETQHMCQICDPATWMWTDEITIPQQGIFAQTTACYATREIARLGPYQCAYDIYVKGHIDDTFIVKNTAGQTVCNPNDRQHHMTDGVLYTIPPGQSVVVYAKDVGCSIIAWERDYHGAEARTPIKPTMELQKTSHYAGYCNPNI